MTKRSAARWLATLLWVIASGAGARAQSPEFDLLIRNGHVIDPRNAIDGVMDVAIAAGRISRVGSSLNPASARRVVDATGLYVVPGLIDIHAHVFYGTEKDAYLSNADTAVQPDSHSFRSGQTTLVDAGGPGGGTSCSSRSRSSTARRPASSSFINIVGSGMKGGPVEQNLADMDAKLTAMRIRQHPGVDRRDQGGALHRRRVGSGRRAPSRPGARPNVPVMVDFGGHDPPQSLEDLLLKHLRPGDILTHIYAHVGGRMPIVDEHGQGPALRAWRRASAASSSTPATAAAASCSVRPCRR